MATNPYFNQFNNVGEQNLYEDLVVESTKIYAHDMVYMPRTVNTADDLLNEVVIAEFNKAIDVEMYIKNFDSFEGEGQLLSKFGLEIRDQMSLILTVRSFKEFIQPVTTLPRPGEGDCIFIPMLGVVYQIKFVNNSPVFYGFGKLNTYEITAELLEFSNEQFNTGRAIIDDLNKPFQNQNDSGYDLESYDNQAMNETIQVESDQVLDFSEMNPFILGEE